MVSVSTHLRAKSLIQRSSNRRDDARLVSFASRRWVHMLIFEGLKQIHMKTTRIMALAVLIVGSGVALHVAAAQQAGTKRTDLQRHDLSAPGREVVQVRVDFDPGLSPPGTRTPAKRSCMSSKARWSIRSRASRRRRSRLATCCSSRPERFTRRRTSAVATGRSWRRISSKKGSRSSWWSSERS